MGKSVLGLEKILLHYKVCLPLTSTFQALVNAPGIKLFEAFPLFLIYSLDIELINIQAEVIIYLITFTLPKLTVKKLQLESHFL